MHKICGSALSSSYILVQCVGVSQGECPFDVGGAVGCKGACQTEVHTTHRCQPARILDSPGFITLSMRKADHCSIEEARQPDSQS